MQQRGLAQGTFGGNAVRRWTAKRRDMFLRMTRSFRIWTGWLIALGYLACVLAPGAALAFQASPAPCFDIGVAAAPMHPHEGGAIQGEAMHMHQHIGDGAPSAPHHHDGNASPGPCCAMMCATALPASLPALVAPLQPVSTCAAEADLSLPGEAPPLLYRPPIRLS